MKEKYLIDAIKEYEKRLSRYAKVAIKELPDERIRDGEKEAEAVLLKEGGAILKSIPEKAYTIALAIEGDMISSENLASLILEKGTYGTSDICFVIGGSLGLSTEVKSRANMLLSFSRMTFLHTMTRVILMEQLYRAFKINSGETYHK